VYFIVVYATIILGSKKTLFLRYRHLKPRRWITLGDPGSEVVRGSLRSVNDKKLIN